MYLNANVQQQAKNKIVPIFQICPANWSITRQLLIMALKQIQFQTTAERYKHWKLFLLLSLLSQYVSP